MLTDLMKLISKTMIFKDGTAIQVAFPAFIYEEWKKDTGFRAFVRKNIERIEEEKQ